MIRVCHFTSAHPSNDIRIFHKECSSLTKQGYEVFLVAANAKEETINGVQIVNGSTTKRKRLGRMLFTAREVYRKARSIDADIYHFHDPELLPYVAKLKRKNKIVIYDAHEDLPRQIMGKEYLRFKKTIAKIVEWYENKVAQKVDAVVAATPFIAARFQKINPTSKAINNFPLMSEIDFSGRAQDDVTNTICFIGNISRIRGTQELVDSLQYTDATLDLAGEIPSDLRQSLEHSKGWKQVNELGYIDRKTALNIKQKAVAGIVTFLPLPNHIDAQPNKIFEYMAAELPVIGSNFPLWKELIEGNKCGICVDPTNPQEIAKAINYLIANPAIAREMGKKGKQLVLETYNWDIEQEVLATLYSTLIATH